VDIEQGRCLFWTNWGVVGGDKIVGTFRSKGTIVFELKCHEKEQFRGLKKQNKERERGSTCEPMELDVSGHLFSGNDLFSTEPVSVDKTAEHDDGIG
jgi:hypothetical protein